MFFLIDCLSIFFPDKIEFQESSRIKNNIQRIRPLFESFELKSVLSAQPRIKSLFDKFFILVLLMACVDFWRMEKPTIRHDFIYSTRPTIVNNWLFSVKSPFVGSIDLHRFVKLLAGLIYSTSDDINFLQINVDPFWGAAIIIGQIRFRLLWLMANLVLVTHIHHRCYLLAHFWF